jgi:hypothetical protein
MSGQISIAISTTSQVMSWSPTDPYLPAAQPPTITVNGLAIQPSNPPYSPTGFQLLVFDITQTIPTPASILVNQWCLVTPADDKSNNWWSTYDDAYMGAVSSLLSAGDPANQLVILASFGLDNFMPPDNEAYALFMNYGAGQQLQTWVKTRNFGCQVWGPTSWVSFPANYLFVGFGGSGYGHGSENYEAAQGSATSISSTLNVNLHPDTRSLQAA